MKIKNIYGREVSINVAKYKIDWHKEISEPQKKVKDALFPYWAGHFVCEEFCIPSSRMRIDLINFTLGVIVEVSPKSSHKFNSFFHNNRPKFLAAAKRDMQKAEWAANNGFEYVEITSEDLKSTDLILSKLNI